VHADQGLVEVVVKLAVEAAAPDSEARRTLQACAARIGVPLRPLDPSSIDPDLGTYFIGHVTPAALDKVLGELQQCQGVEGAYAKAGDEAP
jgi:hypothetical protein